VLLPYICEVYLGTANNEKDMLTIGSYHKSIERFI